MTENLTENRIPNTETDSSAEVKRLVKNWRAMLDIIPEMVLLVRDDLAIQYMNLQAQLVLGDLRGKKCTDVLCGDGAGCNTNCPVQKAFCGTNHIGDLAETRIGEMDIEFTSVPFQGYSGDILSMILMRNISQRKRQERELKAFNNDIEEILRIKIDELKESESLRQRLAREVNVLKRRAKVLGSDDGMVGSSRKMQELRDTVHQVAESDATILIFGESGTGKELVANMIRQHSSRSDKPFLKVNCNAINENLLESDLFGYEKGAFTGAAARKKGKFEIVDGGTIFLDEIGDISPRMQGSLLRILQNGELVRVGGTSPVMVDVRVIAATHVDLAKAVQDDRFRLDLYYRLNIIKIGMPALRERKEDIVELATHFVRHYRAAFKKDIDFLPSKIIDRLLEHDWPGNVRELENVIQRAVLMAKNNVITDQDLVFDASPEMRSQDNYFAKMTEMLSRGTLKKVLSDFESDIISHALHESKGNVLQAARMLDVGKTALYDKIKRYDITAKVVTPS
nr:sigma-54-dependent Fis family transcriptional regulator [Desulfobulbaceae bacterium]